VTYAEKSATAHRYQTNGRKSSTKYNGQENQHENLLNTSVQHAEQNIKASTNYLNRGRNTAMTYSSQREKQVAEDVKRNQDLDTEQHQRAINRNPQYD